MPSLQFGNVPGNFGLFGTPTPLTMQSNSLPGTVVASITTTVPGNPAVTLPNTAAGQLQLQATPLQLLVGQTPPDYTSSAPNHVATILIQATATDGSGASLTMPWNIAISAISTPLGPTGPTSANSVDNLTQGYLISALTGPFNDGTHTNAKVKITADNVGTPYTNGKVQLDWSGTQLLTGPTPLTSGSETAWYQKDFGGALTYTQFTVTGQSAAAPSGLTWTPAGSNLYEGYSGPQYSAGTLTGTAHGANNSLLWTLTTNPGNFWTVDHATGEVYPRTPTSFATASSYALVATATDALGQTGTVSFTVTIQAWTPAALNDTAAGTSVLAWFDMNLGTPSPASGTLNSLTGPDGSVWNKVGATGPAIVASAMNGKTVARFTATQAMSCSSVNSLIAQLGPTGSASATWASPWSILTVAKNSYSGGNAAYLAAILNGTTSDLWSAQNTASAAALSISGTASWTALPNGTAENLGLYNTGGNSLSTPPGNQSQTLQNVTSGATNLGSPPTLTSATVDNVVLGGQSATAAPTIGFQGDVPLFVVVKGIPNATQLRAWSLYVGATFGLATQTVPLTLNWSNYTNVANNDFENPWLPTYWNDPLFNNLNGIWSPAPVYNTPNPAGFIITSLPYASWQLNPANPLYYNITSVFQQTASTIKLLAQATPGQMAQYIGNSFYQGYNPNFLPGTNYPYEAGFMCSQNTFKQQWGLFSVRFKMTPSSGLWPAFWMYSSSHGTTEFDFMEVFGAQVDGAPLTSWHTTRHIVSLSGGQDVFIPTVPDWSDTTGNWVEYTLDWQPDFMTWYVNGVQVGPQQATPADANGPMFLLANNAVATGASFTFPPNPGIFPAYLWMDFFRAYTKNGTLPTPTPPGGTNPQTTAFQTAVTAAGGSLTGGEVTAINTWYNTMQGYFYDRLRPSASLYSKFDKFYCFAFANSVARTVDLINPGSNNLINSGGVTFGTGFVQGNGTSSYLETAYDPATAGGGLTARDVQMVAYVTSPPSNDTKGYLFGNNIDTLRLEPTTLNVAPIQAATQFTWPTTSPLGVGNNPITAGAYRFTRVSTGITGGLDPFTAYKDGAFFAMINSSSALTTFTAGKTFRICGSNTNLATFSDAQLGYVGWGASLTPDEVTVCDPTCYALLHACAPTVYP